MILDKWENALCYLGISPEMDAALRHVAALSPGSLNPGDHVELMGERAYANVSQVTLWPKPLNFEFHRQYADIHVPLTGTERIALCPAANCPAGIPFDAEKDCALFPGEAVNVAEVPTGWFLVCFPQDAHVPCMGAREQTIVKAVYKVRVA